MPERSTAEHGNPLTDHATLTGDAYRDDRNLSARQLMYRWQTPRYDLPGLVAQQLNGVRGRLVDVGCGNGTYLKRFRKELPHLELLGIDLSAGMLDGVPGPVAVADAVRLPLADGSANVVLAMHMLYHVPDIAATIRELARVTGEGGQLIVSTNSAGDKAELDALWQRAAAEVAGTGRGPVRLSPNWPFSLEKAPHFLGESFRKVRTTELPSTISLRKAEPVVTYLASYRAWANDRSLPFDETLDRARSIVQTHIDQHGSFDITCLSGILTCEP